MKFSASMIKTYSKCQQMAKFNYIERLPDKQSASATFGTCVHEALEQYNEHHDVDKAVARFLYTWENPSALGVEPDFWHRRVTYGGLQETGVKCILEYHESAAWANREMIAAEHKFCVPFGHHHLSGIVDMIEATRNSGEELRVCDYKTSGSKPNFDSLYLDLQFCADEETEILTRRGWKRFDQVLVGEDVMTLNHDTDMAEWQPALDVHTFQATDQTLLSMEGKAHSSLTTLNHRWPVQHRVTSSSSSRIEKRVVLSEDLTGSDRVICAADVANLPNAAKYQSSFVELVSWFWTEGHLMEGGSVSISQSDSVNPDYVARIRGALTDLYGAPLASLRNGGQSLPQPAWRESVDSDVTRFYLNRTASLELLQVFVDPSVKVVDPQFVASLTLDQLQLFIDVSLMADGSEQNGCRVITQSVRERLDPFQMACSLLGMRTSLRKTAVGGSGAYAGREFWILSIKDRRPLFAPVKSVRSEVQYTGTVWCPRTANGTWFARRNGQVYFTGNTIYYYASMQPEFWLGFDDGTSMTQNDDGSPRYPPMENGQELYERFKDADRKVIWYHLRQNKELDCGPRDDGDFLRLLRCCDEIEKAMKYDVYVPSISGDACTFCPYTEQCKAYVPPVDPGF
jgi:hypothetical protein